MTSSVTLAGATRPPIGDGNSPWNEAFSFATVAEYLAFRAARPDLFDRELSAEERTKRWKTFGQTLEGQALRVR